MDESVVQSPSSPPTSEPEVVQSESLRQFALFVLSTQRDPGSLPHPQILKGYDEIQPGFAERIMTMTEEEQKHRHQLETTLIKDSLNLKRIGQMFGFLIGMACLVSGTIIALQGHAVEGTLLSGATIVSLVSIFVLGSRKQSARQDSDTSD